MLLCTTIILLSAMKGGDFMADLRKYAKSSTICNGFVAEFSIE